MSIDLSYTAIENRIQPTPKSREWEHFESVASSSHWDRDSICAGVVAAVLVQQRRMAFRVTCEVFRGQPLDDVLRAVPSGSLGFIHLDDSYDPYAVVIVPFGQVRFKVRCSRSFGELKANHSSGTGPLSPRSRMSFVGYFKYRAMSSLSVTRVVDATPSDS